MTEDEFRFFDSITSFTRKNPNKLADVLKAATKGVEIKINDLLKSQSNIETALLMALTSDFNAHDCATMVQRIHESGIFYNWNPTALVSDCAKRFKKIEETEK